MSTTCQTIVDRARALSPLNVPLTADRAEMLGRIRADQQELFTRLADKTRDRLQTTAGVSSTNASADRVIDLSGVTPPIERVLQLKLVDGREVSQVDFLDVDAELAPRYFVRGRTLVEVSNDWRSTAGIVTGTIVYVYGPTDITPSGALSQNVSVDDQWINLLVLPLGVYLHTKDTGARDASERQQLLADLGDWDEGTGLRGAFLRHLENYGGVESRRFVQPSPGDSGRR